MQQIPTTPAAAPTRTEPAAAETVKVVSLAVARNRRANRNRPRPTLAELEALDLRGVDLDRMTPEAREHYWFNLNKHARHLYVAACDLSMRECEHPYSPICVHHVRNAELERMGMRSRGTRYFGLQMMLDAFQILGAAACGALATKPTLFGAAGAIPLATAMTFTVVVFVLREALAARS